MGERIGKRMGLQLKADLYNIKRGDHESVRKRQRNLKLYTAVDYLAINPAVAPAITTWLLEPFDFVSDKPHR